MFVGSPSCVYRGRLAALYQTWCNKAQEIQGAILPVAEKYGWDKPFLGVILAGVFTSGSITQMKSSGFDIALFPYDSIVKAFLAVGIKADFDEDTSDVTFEEDGQEN